MKLRKMNSTSKTKLLKEGSYLSRDTPFTNKATDDLTSNRITTQESIHGNGNSQHDKSISISNFNGNKCKETEINQTLDSARGSENNNNKINIKYIEFFEAAKQGNREKLNEILNLNLIPDINITDLKSRTALHYAVNEGKFKTVCYLLERGINPNIQTYDNKEVALHVACRKAYKRIIICLLNYNANPNLQDINGKTCLHVAAELNSKEHLIAFLNHCKYPISWSIEDNLRRRCNEVSPSNEIRRMLNAYMKTSATERINRETRIKSNKINKRDIISLSGSRSCSKENKSLSKRDFKSESKPKDSNQEGTEVNQVSNVIIHQTRNESVQRMFKNMKVNKIKYGGVRKHINIADSKPALNKTNSAPNDESLNKSANYAKRFQLKYHGNKTMKLHDKLDEELQNIILHQKTKNAKMNLDNKNMGINSKLTKQKSKNDIKYQNQGGKTLENKGDHLSGDIFVKDFNSNTKIAEYFNNSRRLSCEEDPSAVPKIEISLSECFNSKQKESSESESKSERKRDFYSNTKPQLAHSKELNQDIKAGQNCSDVKKHLIKSSNKQVSPDSPLLSIDSDVDEGKKNNSINKTQEISDMYKLKNK